MVTHFFLSDVSRPLSTRKISAKGHASTKHVLRIFQRVTQPRHPPKQRHMRSDECPRAKALRKADRSPIRLPHFIPRPVRESRELSSSQLRSQSSALAKAAIQTLPELNPLAALNTKVSNAQIAAFAESGRIACPQIKDGPLLSLAEGHSAAVRPVEPAIRCDCKIPAPTNSHCADLC